jgi:hypothetical protein
VKNYIWWLNYVALRHNWNLMYRPSSCWFRTATSSGTCRTTPETSWPPDRTYSLTDRLSRCSRISSLTAPGFTSWNSNTETFPLCSTSLFTHARSSILAVSCSPCAGHWRYSFCCAANALLIVPWSLLTGGHVVIRQSQHATRWVTVKLRKLSLRTVSRLSRLHGACSCC